jgi:hypothetical protein
MVRRRAEDRLQRVAERPCERKRSRQSSAHQKRDVDVVQQAHCRRRDRLVVVVAIDALRSPGRKRTAHRNRPRRPSCRSSAYPAVLEATWWPESTFATRRMHTPPPFKGSATARGRHGRSSQRGSLRCRWVWGFRLAVTDRIGRPLARWLDAGWFVDDHIPVRDRLGELNTGQQWRTPRMGPAGRTGRRQGATTSSPHPDQLGGNAGRLCERVAYHVALLLPDGRRAWSVPTALDPGRPRLRGVRHPE